MGNSSDREKDEVSCTDIQDSNKLSEEKKVLSDDLSADRTDVDNTESVGKDELDSKESVGKTILNFIQSIGKSESNDNQAERKAETDSCQNVGKSEADNNQSGGKSESDNQSGGTIEYEEHSKGETDSENLQHVENSKLDDKNQPVIKPAFDKKHPAAKTLSDKKQPITDTAPSNKYVAKTTSDKKQHVAKTTSDKKQHVDKTASDKKKAVGKTVSDEKHPIDKTASDEKHPTGKTTSNKKHPVDKPASDKKQPVDKPVSDKKQPVDKPASDKKHPVDKTATDKKQPVDKPASDKKQPVDKPVSDKKQPVDKPASDKKHPVDKTATDKKQPVDKPASDKKQPVYKPASDKKHPIDKSATDKKQPVDRSESDKDLSVGRNKRQQDIKQSEGKTDGDKKLQVAITQSDHSQTASKGQSNIKQSVGKDQSESKQPVGITKLNNKQYGGKSQTHRTKSIDNCSERYFNANSRPNTKQQIVGYMHGKDITVGSAHPQNTDLNRGQRHGFKNARKTILKHFGEDYSEVGARNCDRTGNIFKGNHTVHHRVRFHNLYQVKEEDEDEEDENINVNPKAGDVIHKSSMAGVRTGKWKCCDTASQLTTIGLEGGLPLLRKMRFITSMNRMSCQKRINEDEDTGISGWKDGETAHSGTTHRRNLSLDTVAQKKQTPNDIGICFLGDRRLATVCKEGPASKEGTPSVMGGLQFVTSMTKMAHQRPNAQKGDIGLSRRKGSKTFGNKDTTAESGCPVMGGLPFVSSVHKMTQQKQLREDNDTVDREVAAAHTPPTVIEPAHLFARGNFVTSMNRLTRQKQIRDEDCDLHGDTREGTFSNEAAMVDKGGHSLMGDLNLVTTLNKTTQEKRKRRVQSVHKEGITNDDAGSSLMGDLHLVTSMFKMAWQKEPEIEANDLGETIQKDDTSAGVGNLHFSEVLSSTLCSDNIAQLKTNTSPERSEGGIHNTDVTAEDDDQLPTNGLNFVTAINAMTQHKQNSDTDQRDCDTELRGSTLDNEDGHLDLEGFRFDSDSDSVSSQATETSFLNISEMGDDGDRVMDGDMELKFVVNESVVTPQRYQRERMSCSFDSLDIDMFLANEAYDDNESIYVDSLCDQTDPCTKHDFNEEFKDSLDMSDFSYSDNDSRRVQETVTDVNVSEAKLRASLSWILHKAYRDSIPAEFKDPFYETDQGAWQMKPHLVRLLTSSEIYCQACTNMFPNRSSQWQGHWSIIQVLSRKGIYVTGSDDSTVTETVLIQTAPFNMDAHVSLITSLMVAYTCEQVTVERVVQAVRRLTTFNASSELPSGAEDTVMFWINKVCSVAQSRDPKSQHVLQGETSQKVRIVSRTPVGEPAQAPVIHDLMADLSDGCSLAVLVSFYCPNLLSYSDICLKENLGIADSLYNLRLVKTFCEHNMPAGCFPFTYEDLLYTPHTLRENILAFLGELFYWFEIQKFDGSRPSTGQALAGVPQVSNATKRSFHQAEDTQLTSTPELNKATSPSSGIPPRQGPLLHKRHQGKTGVNEEEPVRYLEPPKHPRRAHSLSSPQERDTIRQSVIAWEEPASPTHRQQGMKTPVNQSQDSQSSALLANVSIDSELNESFTDDQLGSMNFDLDKSQSPQPTFSDRQTVPSNLLDPSHPDYLEIESVNSRQSNMNSSRSEKLEPLMPAIIRPAKEKHSNHTKAQERGDPFLRKKSTSPTKPRKSRSSPVSSSVTPSQGDITVEAVVTLPGDSSQVMSSDETVVTPLPDDLLTARSGDGDCDSPDSQQKGFEAFYINPEISVEVSLPPVSSQSPRALSAGSHSDESEVTASYTIDQTHTLETARAAGIPVVQSGDGVHIRRTTSRDGSVSSSRSSGDFSDHESHKIHLDHKARETADLKTSLSFPSRNRQSPDVVDTQKPKLVITDQLPKTLAQTLANKDKRPLTTNFAEIKRIKETYGNIDNSGLVYMQNGQEPKGNGNTNTLKSAFYRKQNEPGGKKTTFATLPNETTWIAQRASQASAAQAQSNGAESQPVSSELSQLRMKLDEKRKEIEKKKQRMEMQQNKMRRRLGKDAFYRVVSRHMDDVPDGTTAQAVPGDRTASEIGEMLGHQVPGATDAHRPTSFVEPSSHAAQRSRPFSREGIQQTIDNVRKKWFKEDDLVGGAKPPDDECMTLSQEEKLGPLLHVQSQPVPSPPSQAMTDSQHSTSSQHSTGSQPESFEVYDSSLDKLNKSLTDLQGEIARLSLQQEQIKFLQSPQGYAQADMQMHLQGGPMTNVSNIPPQSFPKQTGYTTPPQQVTQMGQGGPHQPYATSQNQFVPGAGSQGFPAPATSQMYVTQSASQKHVPYQPSQTLPYASPIMAATSYQPVTQPTSSHHIPQYSTMGSQMPTSTHHPLPTSTPIPPSALSTERKIPTPPGYTLPPHSPDAQPNADTASEDSSSTQDTMANGNGFFVSFGDETPKRAKPKLGKDRTKKEQKPETPVSNPASAAPQAAAAPAALASSSLPASASPSFSNTSAPSQPPPSVHTNHHTANTGFVIEERELTPDKVQNSDDEMAKKRERILQMQVKRKEEQERKRLEKEDEAAKQREALRLKQEEAERKKAEEKARRDQIYQQYLHRKQHQEDEENGIERPQERPAKSKPRPKSMFVKATNSPPHDDEGLVCSLDDLSARAFVIPSSGGAAFSCNTLTQNGRPGGMTYRRPPSPDLYRLQQRRNRSNDSSETGSNAGSDYTGPKLFVKPSSKSNRNIIMNAISHCCLAGCVNTDTKNKVLEIISQSDAKHFLILFRDGGCQFKGLYTYAPEIEEIFKIHGVGPKQITNKMVEKFYKYNSGAKSFTEVKSTKHISVSIDAVVVHNALWKTSKPGAAKK
ncbi:calmodulin-regulated spectrin-associated protein 1-like isoform X2 [Haliotis rufescens]|uniref:calmodulin-regulated spectrin-associated protein 1-like isoform X2 n=1 Tax=Haliotis rufescens TaxID=6454 RepID=UPI00201F73B4|nr:calmodulin-regulated spectrin-associated protein 1-like isoform X2 [Haliotis rufescens]